VILSVVNVETEGKPTAYEANIDEVASDYSQWLDDDSDETNDEKPDAADASHGDADDGRDAAANNSAADGTTTVPVEVAAVQALFGPFFSAFIGHTFELIYVPHELCPGQGA
jgi:hypothetical protein